MSTLSVCLIVKNEAKYLRNCLSSVQKIADQIVVVDTGSDDDSIPIAQSFKARIEQFEWIDDFAAARNKSLDLASADWILHIDADETLDEDSQQNLRQLIASSDTDAYQLSVRNYHPPEDMIAFQDSVQIRLFRNKPEFRFQNRVHEQIYPSLDKTGAQIQNSNLLIHHYGYRHNNQNKAQRNLPILRAILRENPDDAYSWFKLGETYKGLHRAQDALDAFAKALAVEGKSPLDPKTAELLFVRRAQLELQKDRYKDSLESAKQSLALNPRNALTLYVASVSALYLANVDLAQKYLNQLMRLNINGAIPVSDVEQLLSACTQLKAGGQH